MKKSSKLIWRIAQLLVWLIGMIILFCLFFYPTIGIHLFWNILIPIAPALLVVATGLWRNICPMASTALFSRHANLSKQMKLPPKQQALLGLIAIIILYLIVPLRHILFNTNGMATAILIMSLGALAWIMGSLFDWKSGWCSSLCPIHPVEKFYGTKSTLNLKNAHCSTCIKCTTPCPDTTPNIHPFSTDKFSYQKISGFLLVGGFPGFIWGWFHVADYTGTITFQKLIEAYQLPLFGFLATLFLFFAGTKVLKSNLHQKLFRIYAAAAVTCYYWYRLPALFGFGMFNEDGMLVDLSYYISANTMNGIIIITSLFFFWWMVLKKQIQTSWLIRPKYA